MLYAPPPGSSTRGTVGRGVWVDVDWGADSESLITTVNVADGWIKEVCVGVTADEMPHAEITHIIPESNRAVMNVLESLLMFSFRSLPQRFELINIKLAQHHITLTRKSLHMPESITKALICLT
jgi:hypothetical protein